MNGFKVSLHFECDICSLLDNSTRVKKTAHGFFRAKHSKTHQELEKKFLRMHSGVLLQMRLKGRISERT